MADKHCSVKRWIILKMDGRFMPWRVRRWTGLLDDRWGCQAIEELRPIVEAAITPGSWEWWDADPGQVDVMEDYQR